MGRPLLTFVLLFALSGLCWETLASDLNVSEDGFNGFCKLGPTGTGYVMGSWFGPTWSENQWCVLLWFEGWTLDTKAKYAMALILIFVMATSNEGFSMLRRKMGPGQNQVPSSTLQLARVLLYGAQMIVAYLLMLVVMTYEINLCMSLLVGLMSGHYFFTLRPAARETQHKSRLGELGSMREPLAKQHMSSHTPCCGGNNIS